MPMIGNSHTDDPLCAWVTGSTCNLWIRVYRSGCLRDWVPLRGKGTSDWLPVDVSGKSGQGSTHTSAGSTSGLASGPSESGGWPVTDRTHLLDMISVSASGLSAGPVHQCTNVQGDLP